MIGVSPLSSEGILRGGRRAALKSCRAPTYGRRGHGDGRPSYRDIERHGAHERGRRWPGGIGKVAIVTGRGGEGLGRRPLEKTSPTLTAQRLWLLPGVKLWDNNRWNGACRLPSIQDRGDCPRPVTSVCVCSFCACCFRKKPPHSS
ncbi:unnamed protein product [Hapterophycus canaliculatus]